MLATHSHEVTHIPWGATILQLNHVVDYLARCDQPDLTAQLTQWIMTYVCVSEPSPASGAIDVLAIVYLMLIAALRSAHEAVLLAAVGTR